jgi:hypothetical protein
MELSKLEADAHLDVPVEVGRNIKALFADARYQVAVKFIVESLCGQRRLSFVPGQPSPADLMMWREGRRFVGEWLMRIVETPIPDAQEPEPPARTMTEKHERRTRRKAAGREGE